MSNRPQFYPECAHLEIGGEGDDIPGEEWYKKFPGSYAEDGEHLNPWRLAPEGTMDADVEQIRKYSSTSTMRNTLKRRTTPSTAVQCGPGTRNDPICQVGQTNAPAGYMLNTRAFQQKFRKRKHVT